MGHGGMGAGRWKHWQSKAGHGGEVTVCKRSAFVDLTPLMLAESTEVRVKQGRISSGSIL